jgi:hypothetical protein
LKLKAACPDNVAALASHPSKNTKGGAATVFANVHQRRRNVGQPARLYCFLRCGPPAHSVSEEPFLTEGQFGIVSVTIIPAKVERITFLSDLSEVNAEHDNIDVHVTLNDGRELTFVVATPNNVLWCMENENLDYFYGEPMLFVKCLTRENIERAIRAIVEDENSRWLQMYGA